MKKNISKDLILKACIAKQEELVSNFDSRVSEVKADASSQRQSASQSEDRTAGNVEVLDALQNELTFVQMEMRSLKAINPDHVNNKVEPGAVVVTNKRTFFIAVSSEKIEIDGQEIFGISTNAPIFSAMMDLKKGDTFEFNNTSYKIQEIY